MKITRYNYEIFFIDYFDGRLSKEQKKELFNFLSIYPDLKAEFDEFEMINLPEENIEFPNKELLKKSNVVEVSNINENNYEYYFIAWHEGDLSNNEKFRLEEFLRLNPELNKDFELYKLTKLKADTSVIYQDKKSLKKHIIGTNYKKILYYSISVAASLLIAISIFFSINKHSQNEFTGGRKAISKFNEIPNLNIKTDEKSFILSESNLEEYKVTKSHITGNKKTEVIQPKDLYADEQINFIKIKNPTRIESNNIQSTTLVASDNEFINAYNAIVERERYLHSTGQSQYDEGNQGGLFAGLSETVGDNFNSLVKLTENVSGWTLAELAVSGFNRITDNDATIYFARNDDGKVEKVLLNDRVINLP